MRDEVKKQIRRLGHRDLNVRARAAEALVQIGEPAVEPLIRALGYGSWIMRAGAAGALGRRGEGGLAQAVLAVWAGQQGAAEALGRLGEARAVEPLIRALGDGNRDVRVRAAEALGQLGDRRALPALKARARIIGGDDSPAVREAYRKAIAQIEAATGRKEVVPAPAPAGTGKEVTPAGPPVGRGTEVRPAEEK